MAFEYGESYYGLRTFGSSVGDVKDASATLTATSSIANVNYVVAIGADATITVTSSATCSAEQFVLEESDRYVYGSGLYGRNVFAGDADLQTVVTATSSVTGSCERIRLGSATSTVTSSIVALGGFLGNTGGTITATSASTCSGQRIGERSATSTQNSATTANATATFSDPVQITATSTATATAEKFFLESSDKFAYGSGLYGYNNYDAEDLQTIISATSVDTTCTGAKVNLASATSSVTSGTTASAERIEQPTATATVTSSSTSAGLVVYVGAATMTSTSTTTQTSNNTRVRESTGIVSSTSGIATIAREKWEVIPPTSITWTQIAA
jgi:hypothetical protein